MGFFFQLRMLLWKNYLLRKRQKFRLFVELVWPLFLFLILIWVRTRGLRENISECHFTPKAMPSVGQLPFLQSFFCSFKNTCHKTEKEAQIDGSNLRAVRYNDLLQDMATLSSNELAGRNLQAVENVVGDIDRLARILQGITARQIPNKGAVHIPELMNNTQWVKEEIFKRNISLSESAVDSLLQAKIVPQSLTLDQTRKLRDNASAILCDKQLMADLVTIEPTVSAELCSLPIDQQTALSKVLVEALTTAGTYQQFIKYIESSLDRTLAWQDWRLMANVSTQLLEKFTTLKNYTEAVNDVTTATSKYALLSEEMAANNISQPEQSVLMLSRFLCGNNSEDLYGQLMNAGGNTTPWDAIQEQLRNSQINQKAYEYDNTTTPFCNSYFEKFDSSPALWALWRMIKPFIRGKILYAPETPVTKKIMDQLNAAFSTIQDMHTFSNRLTTTVLPDLKSSLVPDSVQLTILKEFLYSPTGQVIFNNSLLRTFLGDNYTRIIEGVKNDLDEFFEPINTNYRRETFDRLINITTNATELLECFDWDKVVSYPSEEKGMVAGMELVELNKLWAFVVFIDPGHDTLNPNTTYKIRMSTDRVDNTEFIQDSLQRPGARMRPAIDLKYITYGFAYIQDMLDYLIIKEHSGREDPPGVFLQQFPYPCYIEDRFILAISRTFPLFMVLAWIYTCAMIVKSVVYEKEQRLKETMRVMGLSNGVHWVGWFIDSSIPMMVTIILLTTILVYGNILSHANPLLVFCFLTIYGISTIALAFLISTIFSKANLAAASGGIIFFILYLPYSFLVRWIMYMSSLTKALLSLSSNVAFGMGAGYLGLLEERGTGVTWSDLWQSPLYGDSYNLGYVFCTLIFDAVLYFLLTWYIEAVFPGEFGIPRPWYFPVTKSYWCGSRREHDLSDSNDRLINNNPSDEGTTEHFEGEPQGMKRGVAVHNLGMVYSNGKVALNNLNINFYENQITSFLGHNGAGKTTTIGLLTGMFPPTSGTAYVYGLDIRRDMDTIRNSLGMCPQHNVLFNLLTVEETLWFFGLLRGKSQDEVRPEMQQMIEDLGLPHKATSLTRDLSGGMQRKLSVAVAFIGGSKTVILDEPTSGVDPYSRRTIWDLLIKYKKDRTVILTTHYMDEADLLGDRIAIIANGQLQCCGSSIFLKSQFGSGYYLTVELPPQAAEMDSKNTIKGVTEFIRKYVPAAQLLENVGDECLYLLPPTSNKDLPVLFKALDKSRTSLGVGSYGISDTSLEEIFLRVTEDNYPRETNSAANKPLGCFKRFWNNLFGSEKTNILDSPQQIPINKTEAKELSVRKGRSTVKYTVIPTLDEDHEVITPPPKKNWRQFVALCVKRFHHTRRNKKALFSELIIPAVFVCITLIVTSILPGVRERPSLYLSPWLYPDPRNTFLSENATDKWTTKYLSEIKGPLGIGALCLPEHRDERCTTPTDYAMPIASTFGPSCSCDTGVQVCPADSGKPDPPSFTIASDDTMYYLTGANISDWILKSQERFGRTRIGGFTLGVESPVPNWDLSEGMDRLYQLANSTVLIRSDPASVQGERQVSANDSTINNNNMIWFYNKAWASSVSYMNAMSNVVLRASMPEDVEDKYSINTINHPMNFSRSEANIAIGTNGVSLLHSIAVLFALSFVTASFTLYLIEERVTNSKHLQVVSGVNRVVYWLQAYFWDLVCYMVSAALCVFIFLAFNEQSYISPTNFPGLISLLVLFGWSCVALMYPFSFYFDVPSSAFVALACCNMFIGIITTITTFVLAVFDDEELREVSDVLKIVFLVFPHFCLGSGLLKLAAGHLAKETLATYDLELDTNIFAWDVLGVHLTCMFVTGIIFFLITLMVEFQVVQRFIQKVTNPKKVDLPEPLDEEDVKAEKIRVLTGETSKDVLLVKNLSKVYKKSGSVKPAVNQICFGVQQGECFGLLGLNGAGKTSTFKMLTGATSISSGKASVKGYDVMKDVDHVRSLLGYCPQFDALDPLLTPREHLEFYARLRNIPHHKLPQAVDSSMKKLGLGHYSDRLAGTLSGGNKRKLSTAIALLGDPPLIFLDEPTTGMDPKSRRFLWGCIQDVVRQGRSVILTSHSMEECEALCTRLTIMVNGEFKCLGSCQHLKAKYGGGYSLVLKCRPDMVEAVHSYISKRLPSALLIEAHYSQLRYQTTSLSLDTLFEAMEAAKAQGHIQDFSLSQTTLEEVFLRFASDQSDAVKSRKSVLRYIRRAVMFKCSCCKGSPVGANP